MDYRGALRIVSSVLIAIFLPANAVGAKDLYPSLGELVDALSRELAWPDGSTTEEKVHQLRAEKVVPSHLTQNHLATPTVVMTVMGGLLQRSRAKGDDPNMALSALIQAAVATGAPIPTFAPDEISNLNLVFEPSVQAEIEVSLVYPLPGFYSAPSFPFVIVPRGLKGDRFSRGKRHDSQRKETLRQFPHTIFREGESPAEKGAGIFPRR